MPTVFFITHPDVAIDPSVPVPEWPFNERGRARMRAMMSRPWVKGIRGVFSSHERKARDGAQILADGLGLSRYGVVAGLGENDRSATGFLGAEEFEADAQARIVRAVEQVMLQAPDEGDVAIIGHGGTGTLLYCHLAGIPISRDYDQPPTNGGNWFGFDRTNRKLLHAGWQSIDAPGERTALDELVIRPAKPADLPDLRRAVVELQDYERRLDATRLPGEQIADAYLAWMQQQAAQHGAVIVAEMGRAFAGFAAGWIIEGDTIAETADSNRTGYVSDVCVLPAYRGQRIAAELLSAIERHLARTGITRVRLASLAANASAQAAYQRAGYERYEIVYEKRIGKQMLRCGRA
ncbi:MAG TPA: GNAT family N-acetyltransferase [Stellaceae bacterium]|nr:GNAT family N-acetyltransferase [Stellaceae bacterium]